MKSMSVPMMIFLLILVFLIVVYYVGFKSSFGAFSSGVTGLTKQLQGGGAGYPGNSGG